MVPADFLFCLILGQHVNGSRPGAAAGEPIAPTELAFGLAIVARLQRALALAFRTVFAALTARIGNAEAFRLAAITNRGELFGVANQFAHLAATRLRVIEQKLVGSRGNG